MCRLQAFQVRQNGSYGRRIQRHQLLWEGNEFVRARGNSPEIEVLKDAPVSRENHFVHRERLALARIDRRRVHAQEFQPAAEQLAGAIF